MTKRAQNAQQNAVAADPDQWSEQSKHSVAFHFKREYVDIPYTCYRCGAACVFTAQDQKYTFEVKKASIDQRRTFCATCWPESHRLPRSKADYRAPRMPCTLWQTLSLVHIRTASHACAQST